MATLPTISQWHPPRIFFAKSTTQGFSAAMISRFVQHNIRLIRVRETLENS
jgi:hypothetical protein